MKRNRKKKKKIINIISKIVAILSIVIAIVFCLYIYRLNMLPSKYFVIMITVLGVIYSILLLFVLLKRIKNGFKIFALLIFILLSFVFVYGIKYADRTYDFINEISGELKQKEEYYISVASSSKIANIDELEGKKVGVYVGPSAINAQKAIDKLNKKISVELVEFTDLEKLFENLLNDKVDALFLNDSQKTVLQGDLSYIKLELKDLDSILVYIDKKEEIVKIVNITNTPFNIYVAGGDAYGNIGNVTNTDVNMVITVDPVDKKILLTSIPRDYYVELPGLGKDARDKLTHAGYYGIEESIKAVENLLDIDINYYVKVNFSTIEGVIDAIDGVDIYSDYSFNEYAFKRYHFDKGPVHLNGNQALAFARERRAFPNGDVQRVKNQQKILEAIIKKITSSPKLVTNFTRILDSVSSSLATNMDSKSINNFVKVQLDDMGGWKVEKQNLVGTDYSSTSTYTFPGLNLYVMKADEESVNTAKENIKKMINS